METSRIAPDPDSHEKKKDVVPSKSEMGARDFGFRCMAKRDWDRMKEEYLNLQQKLLKKVIDVSNKSQNGPVSHRRQRPVSSGRVATSASGVEKVDTIDAERRDYPLGCLVFVKNIHPDTNKTTLKGLFADVIDIKPEAIDYVDYTKGLDTVRSLIPSLG